MRHCVGCQPSSPQRGTAPQFSAHVCCGQTAGWIKMPLGTEVGLGSGHIVLDGSQPPPKKKRGHSSHSPHFSAHVYCGQTAGWIEMPLVMEVDLGPGDIVLVGDPAPPKKGHSPQFSAHVCCGPNGRPSQLLLSSCTIG